MREIYGEIYGQEMTAQIEAEVNQTKEDFSCAPYKYILLYELLREHRLLSTPTERDEQEKRVIRWGKERTAMMKEITKQERRIAKLKAALDNAEKENNAAWVLNEKLKSGAQGKRIAKLETKLQDATHAGKCASIGELNAQAEIEDLKIQIEGLETQLEDLEGEKHEAEIGLDKLPNTAGGLRKRIEELEAEVERLKVLLGRAATILTEETHKCDGL